MANKIKYTKAQRKKIIRLYAIGRTEGGEYDDGSLYYSKGKYTLRQISEKTGVPVVSVNAIATGRR